MEEAPKSIKDLVKESIKIRYSYLGKEVEARIHNQQNVVSDEDDRSHYYRRCQKGDAAQMCLCTISVLHIPASPCT
eukprot:1159835-Pelagomonas_calceolata.AAC.6